MFRVRNRHRRRLLIKAGDRAGTIAAVRDAVERLRRGPLACARSGSTSIRSSGWRSTSDDRSRSPHVEAERLAGAGFQRLAEQAVVGL